MTEEEIVRAIGLGENEDWEFKDGRGGIGPSVLESVSSFANTSGGVIVCGVLAKDNDKTHELVGIKDPEKYKRNIWNALNNKQQISHSPCASKDVWVAQVGDAQIICVRVPEADRRTRPVYVGPNPLKGSYKRRDSGDYPCTEEEVKQMMRDASSEPQDSLVFDGTSFAHVDLATFRGFRNRVASKRPAHTLLKLDDAPLLAKLGGMKDGRGLTAAGILMFGTADLIKEAFPNLFLDYYEQMDLADTSKRYDDRITSYDADWEPNLFNFFDKARPRLVDGLRTPFGLGDDAMRKGETPFHEAIREALVNCLVHADFMLRGTILVGKRSDAFVFQNPGRSLTPVARIVTARHAGEKLSDVRNPNLVGMFFMAGLAERHGTGYPTIFHAWDEGRRHSPRIEEDLERNTVTVTLPLLSQIAPEVEGELQRSVGADYALLSAMDKDILVQAHQFGEVTNQSLQFSRAETPYTIGMRLKYLADQGWLERDGASGPGRVYRFPKRLRRQRGLFDPLEGGAASPLEGGASGGRLPPDLMALAQRLRSKMRPKRPEVEAVILAICSGRYMTPRELASLLGRTDWNKFRDRYLAKMVLDGRLERRHEAMVHPAQAYRTKGT